MGLASYAIRSLRSWPVHNLACLPAGLTLITSGSNRDLRTCQGQEVLVDMQRRADGPRAFLMPESKKQRKAERKAEKLKRKRGEGAEEEGEAQGEEDGNGDGAAAATEEAPALGGRVGERGYPAVYGVASERLLLLGEADFSFAAALCVPPLLPEGSSIGRRRLTATSFDERPTLRSKYGEALVDRHLKRLKNAGELLESGSNAFVQRSAL